MSKPLMGNSSSSSRSSFSKSSLSSSSFLSLSSDAHVGGGELAAISLAMVRESLVRVLFLTQAMMLVLNDTYGRVPRHQSCRLICKTPAIDLLG